MGEGWKDGKRRCLNHLSHPLLTSSFVIHISFYDSDRCTPLRPNRSSTPLPLSSMGGHQSFGCLRTFMFNCALISYFSKGTWQLWNKSNYEQTKIKVNKIDYLDLSCNQKAIHTRLGFDFTPILIFGQLSSLIITFIMTTCWGEMILEYRKQGSNLQSLIYSCKYFWKCFEIHLLCFRVGTSFV